MIKTSEPSIIKTPVKEIIEVGNADFTGSVEYVDKDPIPFETEIIVDPSLAPNEIVEDQAGVLGEQETKITRTITNGEAGEEVRGETTQTKVPVTRKLRIGSKTNGQYKETETIPFEVEVRKDPSLKKGEWKYNVVGGVPQTGESGLRERTLTIENSQITETSDYTTVREPKKAVILVGDEDFTGVVTHTEHFEIPFEVEVRYNSELPAGTSKEIQKGVQGSYDIEFNQKIKNGAPDGELLKVESNRVDAKKHIIEVGTKVETPENNYSKDVEVEIEYVYDDTKDKGVVETGELTPGKVETRVDDKYNPETGKIEQTTEQVVTNAKQKVIVGTKDFTGTYEYSKTCPIPFEVEIIEDDTLEKGISEVEQKGVPGSKTTKYEQDIKNGQPDGEARKISEETTKEPVKHIVRIGTKPADPTEGETTKTIEREIPYETKVIYDETLESGTQNIENEGKAGKEEVTITQKIKDSKPVGDATETIKTITEKEDRIVRIGVKPVVKEVELGHDTEYRHNPDLKAGEEKVIEEGSNGYIKYTTTFNKETGKLEITEERVEPTNKVVEYGSKTDGEFTYESEKAYDIKVIEDSNLEAGKVVVDQEGVVGKTKTTVKIVNSQKVSEETETLVEKQDKIVRVGTKNVCEIPPVDPEKPGEEDPKDPEVPGDEDPKDPEKPGEEEPKDPEYPEDEDPKDPENPGDEDPKDPENPEGEDPKDPDPGKPEDPKDPDPGKPEDPKDPDPGKPEDPKDPDPGKPEDPKDPDPGKPEDSEPNKPGKPNEPGNPEKPESPDKTETPDKSEKPKNKDQGVRIDFAPKKSEKSKEAQKDNKSNRAPKTGVSGTSGVLLTLFGATSALFASKKNKKL